MSSGLPRGLQGLAGETDKALPDNVAYIHLFILTGEMQECQKWIASQRKDWICSLCQNHGGICHCLCVSLQPRIISFSCGSLL